MQKITPSLWFDNQAEEAAKFYTSLFDNSRIGTVRRYGEAGPGPKGTAMTLDFHLDGARFMALNGGPVFTFTPAVSFFVSCATEDEIDRLWRSFSAGGTVMMELQKYPFSEKFGWLADRYGLSWQLNLTGRKKITPFFMFVGDQHGKAEEAMKAWGSSFKRSRVEQVERYGPNQGGTEGTVMHGRFSLEDQEFMAMDSNQPHAFTFTPALSFFVDCQTQEEIDDLWGKLSDGGRTDQCGWLQDRYGVSWQIVPGVLGDLLGDPDPVKANKVMQAMLAMTKLDIAGLRRASGS
jgi:predicted 3-demethylubiquinone-9 3-methyltransferase (glyoxalase superfamily)